MTKKSERARDGSNRIDVAREFAACVRKMGAVVLDDSLAPNKPKNADYWFAAYNIIGELKQLQEDRLAKPGRKNGSLAFIPHGSPAGYCHRHRARGSG